MTIKESANFIWSIADLLRGEYKQNEYGKVILPLTVLRRMDCALKETKASVIQEYERISELNYSEEMQELFLNKKSGLTFHNRSNFDFDKLVADPNNLTSNLREYIKGFSLEAKDILVQFNFEAQIVKLEKTQLLYQVIKRFQEVDLHPNIITSMQMGYIFEELIRKFAEISNESAGEYFTPREVIKLMVSLLFYKDSDLLAKKGITKTMYDCCAGTGGMLSVAKEYLHDNNTAARLEVFGQEVNEESYAICKSDLLVKGIKPTNIRFGNTLSKDQFPDEKYDYLITNPPFGVEWKKVEKEVKAEYNEKGFGGRFGPGIPAVSDGSLLFLMHLISKMKTAGSRIAIVFNGSPLFAGTTSKSKNESAIRKWIIESDLLESVIALPNQLFYNTGISTYIWILDNNKPKERKGKVQLINAVDFYKKMSKSLGDKRNEISDEHIETITKLYGDFAENEYCKIFNGTDFGFYKVTVERPLRNEVGEIIYDKNLKPKADPILRDTEQIPLSMDIQEYMEREVLPHVPDAWIDESKTLIGYEINFTKYFYKYKPLRSLDDIRADILALEQETEDMIHSIVDTNVNE